MRDDNTIRVRQCSSCPVCGSPGNIFYRELEDAFFGTPGKWSSRKCTNPDCRLVWLDPMPVEEDISIAYQNYFTHQGTAAAKWIESAERSRSLPRRLYELVRKGYLHNKYGYFRASGSARESWLGYLAYLHPGWRASLDSEVYFLPAQYDGRLLEIGSGGGTDLKLMQDLGWSAEGVDRDPEAKKNAEGRGLRVRLGELKDQDYPDDYFDAVVSNHVIEHVFDPVGLFREIHRILKPGGRFVFITPNIESWGHRVFKHADLMFMDSPRHLYVFSVPSFRRVAQAADFEKVMVMTTIRHANSLYLSDKAIDRTGHFEVGNAVSLQDRLGAKGLQAVEWAVLKVRSTAGEEVIMIGEK